MTASSKGIILVKCDRCCKRIKDFADYFIKLEENKETISRENFKDFLKSVDLILTNELNDKGGERKWKK